MGKKPRPGPKLYVVKSIRMVERKLSWVAVNEHPVERGSAVMLVASEWGKGRKARAILVTAAAAAA